jgi:hypothetical protein
VIPEDIFADTSIKENYLGKYLPTEFAKNEAVEILQSTHANNDGRAF